MGLRKGYARTGRYHSSLGCPFVAPRGNMNPVMRRKIHGAIQPMEEEKPSLFAKLFGGRKGSR